MEARARGTLVHLILTVFALIANYTLAAIVIHHILREGKRERERVTGLHTPASSG